MPVASYTDRQIRAAKEALEISDVGACNVAGVANALHEAACAWLEAEHSTTKANKCAPVRLILFQLCYLAFETEDHQDQYATAHAECEVIAACGTSGG